MGMDMCDLDWSTLPAELAYLSAPADKYGAIQFESAIDAYLDGAGEGEMDELGALAERIRLHRDLDATNEWIDRFPLTEHPEAARMYFLLLLLDLAGVDFGG